MVPNLFWQQELVSWKTVFPQTAWGKGWERRAEEGFMMIQERYIHYTAADLIGVGMGKGCKYG